MSSNAENNPPQDQVDNLRAAMSSVIQGVEDMRIQPIVKSDSGPADKQVLIRTTEEERNRWKDAAARQEKNLSAWIRDSLNAEASLNLDCQHPMNETKFYPWATICMKCGQRLWERKNKA